MNTSQYLFAKDKIVSLAASLAPIGAAQRGFATLVNTCDRESTSREETIKILVRALADGVEYGNWPTAE